MKEKRASGKKASIPSKGKSIEDKKEDKKDRGRQSGIHGQATKGIARGIEKKSSTHPTIEDAGALQRRHP